MDLLKLNLFRGGIFKQIKFLVSAPQKAQRVEYHNEVGTLSQEPLSAHTGWVYSDINKKSWQADHALKLRLLKNGEPVQDETILPISDRSYIPLDPLGLIKAKEKETRKSLLDIAGTIHDQVLIDVAKNNDQPTDTAKLIIMGCFIIDALCIVAIIFMRRAA